MICLAPIALFVYNRPRHTRKTLEALLENDLADKSILYVFCDGPKENATSQDLENIKEVRDLVRSKEWCGEVKIIEFSKNQGLAKNIINGVTDVVNRYGKIIVLEDDLVTSRGFLNYMNEGLDLYADEERVMQVSGYMHPLKVKLPEVLFYNVNSCWGWGTWANAWKYLILDTRILLKKLDNNYNAVKYNGGQGNAFYNQLKDNFAGKLDSWAVKWHTSMYLRKGFVLHPGRSLVRNIGHDSSGTNCGSSVDFNYQEIADFVKVKPIPLVENQVIVDSFLKLYYGRCSDSFLLMQFKKIMSLIRKARQKVQSFI